MYCLSIPFYYKLFVIKDKIKILIYVRKRKNKQREDKNNLLLCVLLDLLFFWRQT